MARSKSIHYRDRPRSVQLGKHRLYMLPTRQGYIFALSLFVMLLLAVNYNNGMAYLFTFFLAATTLVSMLHTHKNLQGLGLTAHPGEPVFAGETGKFEVTIDNPSAVPRPAVWLHKDSSVQQVSIEPWQSNRCKVGSGTRRRGYLDAPEISVSTNYPLGLLYTWCRPVRLKARLLVYPAPRSYRDLELSGAPESRDLSGNHPEGDDFSGLRDYLISDPPKHVHWKSAAKGLGLQTKKFSGERSQSIWLDWDSLAGLEDEQRLSQLCHWVLVSESGNFRYGLKLPGMRIVPNQGEKHKKQCLEALATFGI